MSNHLSLAQILLNLDGQSYSAYRQLNGTHKMGDFELAIERIQADPYAPPSSIRVLLPQPIAQFPIDLWQKPIRAIALRDYLTRQFGQAIQQLGLARELEIIQPGQAILARSALWINDQIVEVRFRVNLPAFGRRIAGRQAARLLTEDLPKVVARSLYYPNLNAREIAQHVATAEDAEALRSQLTEKNLVAFIADGSILARRSGIDDRPGEAAIPFTSPPKFRVTLDRPNAGPITGMGIGEGITLIVGGGYHGKSTLLRAIERGIYNHIPGDGREWVVTNPQAVKIRAEDGRCIHGTDLSALINHLPLGQSSQTFTTENASGSTSQAANMIEAIAAGAAVLLMDEDTCATNLMIRDARMQRLIAPEQEPITPLIDKIRPLYEEHRVSTILAMGGCGDYLAVADRVIAMQDFQPRDVTAEAQAIVAALPNQRLSADSPTFGSTIVDRHLPQPLLTPKAPRKPHRGKLQGQTIRFYEQEVDLSAIAQLIEPGQLKTLAAAMVAIDQGWFKGSLAEVIIAFQTQLATELGLDQLTEARSGELVQVRAIELAAALHRLRRLQ